MFVHKRIVGEFTMLLIHAVDLGRLPRPQALLRIQAPDAFEKALPSQHFVAAGDAAGKAIGNIEERCVAVGDLGVQGQ